MKIITAKTYMQKLTGLMGKKNINYGMFFPGVSSIHTYFMKESIDVIGLNDAMIVTSIYENVKPNKILILKNANHTLELPKGESKRYHIGQKVKF
ncbi:putative uncharacterized protein [Clostridium sp. CAG:533]|jgi:uncharacterized membrane protein (UPF0127 family)|nr:putative uncharacterized protein [Clostridium sp. CAG:533]